MKSCLVATYHEDCRTIACTLTGYFVRPLKIFRYIRIIAYPAEEYIDGLSGRTRDQTRKQYREASANGALMVFVRDEQKEFLRSYIFPRADEE